MKKSITNFYKKLSRLSGLFEWSAVHSGMGLRYKKDTRCKREQQGYEKKNLRCATCSPQVWPTRRDSNPRPPESESVAISSFATDGNITYKVYHKKNTVAIFITKNILTYESFYKSIIKKSRSKLRPFFRFPVIRLHSF